MGLKDTHERHMHTCSELVAQCKGNASSWFGLSIALEKLKQEKTNEVLYFMLINIIILTCMIVNGTAEKR